MRAVAADAAVGSPANAAGPIDLPSFVTPEWLSDKIWFGEDDLARLHAGHPRIATMSGFAGWPEEQPDMDLLLRTVAEGLRYPLFVMICNVILNENPDGTLIRAVPMRTLFERFADSHGMTLLHRQTRLLVKNGCTFPDAVFKVRRIGDGITYAFLFGTSVVHAGDAASAIARLRSGDRSTSAVEVERYLGQLLRSIGRSINLSALSRRDSFVDLMRVLQSMERRVGVKNAEDQDRDAEAAAVLPVPTSGGEHAEPLPIVAASDGQGEGRHTDAPGNQAPFPCPAAAPPSVAAPIQTEDDTPTTRALSDWRGALAEAAQALDRLRHCDPDADAIASVSAMLERAGRAAEAWRHAGPGCVAVLTLKQRLYGIAAVIWEAAGIDQEAVCRALDGVSSVSADVAAMAERECASAEGRLAESRRQGCEAATLLADIRSGKLSPSARAGSSARLGTLWGQVAELEARAAAHMTTAVVLLADHSGRP